jgi:glutathione S-transferase
MSQPESFTLYVGNKAYSSWSLRAYLAMAHTGAPFEEVVLPLSTPGSPSKGIGAVSPSGRIPALKHGALVVWDSLAIGEYLADLFPAAKLWPEDRTARAIARSASAEMHAGFPALRTLLNMNVRREPTKRATTPDVDAEIARVVALWKDCRARFGRGGPFLFGSFTVADAMYAPVATRFRTYQVDLDAETNAYIDAIYALPAMRAWIEGAKKETWTIAAYE